MAWLSGYGKRKELEVKGSTAGAQTDYQMKLCVYKGIAPQYPFDETGIAIPFYYGCTPHGYYYNGKTYVVWQGDDLDPYIRTYTHSTGIWSSAVKVGSNPLSGDAHGGCAVIVDNSGYIHVFYGCHQTAIEYAKSTNPEDITSWSQQTDIGSYHAYPQVIKDSSGVLWLFCRVSSTGNEGIWYYKSTDWGTKYQIIAPETTDDNIYLGAPEYDSTNGRVHFSWTHYDGSATKAVNIYHAYLKLADGHMYAMDGTDLGTTISFSEAESNCKIVSDTTNGMRYHSALHLDSDNYPHIVYGISGSTVYYIYWSGSSWESAVSITNDVVGITDFILNSTADIDFYCSNSSKDVEKWHWNGSSWSEEATIIDGTTIDAAKETYGAAAVVGGQSGLQILLQESDIDDFTNADIEIFALDSTDNFVGATSRISLGGNCQDDFDDIRFTQSDGSTELYHWKETGSLVSGVSVDVWIKFNSIPASPSSATFYIYYNNESAESGSDGDNTFPFFDDFPNASIDTDKWTVRAGAVGVSGGNLELTGTTGTRARIEQNASNYPGKQYCAIESRGKGSVTTQYLQNFLGMCESNDLDNRLILSGANVANRVRCFTFEDSSSTTNDVDDQDIANWHRWKAYWKDGEVTFYKDDSLIETHTTNIMDGTAFAYFMEGSTNGEIWYADWIFVRKYVDPEPTWGEIGAEEEPTTARSFGLVLN